MHDRYYRTVRYPSSPARGTWIEIHIRKHRQGGKAVVPRKGDVDRNYTVVELSDDPYVSSPARGTWIEISQTALTSATERSSPARGTWIEIYLSAMFDDCTTVVPRKGDVDRNKKIFAFENEAAPCRPPQGGRG